MTSTSSCRPGEWPSDINTLAQDSGVAGKEVAG
jgi:hypothetical protein